MFRLPFLALAAVCLSGQSAPMDVRLVMPDSRDQGRTDPAGGAETALQRAQDIREKAFARGFKGEIAIDAGNLRLSSQVSPDMLREGYGQITSEVPRWPYASLTKQMLAARLLPELKNMGFTLDTPVSRILPRWPRGPAAPTIRQLLQHRSGLRNPEDTPKGANGWPAFYNEPAKHGLSWCVNGRAAPPASGWAYNNCDYIVLGAVLEAVSLESAEYMLGASRGRLDDEAQNPPGVTISKLRMVSADTAGALYAMKSPEREVIPAYGASGALSGTLMDVLFFNWSQMQAYKDDVPEMKPMWQGDPELGFMALGQWVFEVQPQGCSAPVKVAERKGEIGQYRLTNIMLPELGRSMVLATIDPAFEFGEIWQGEGFKAEAVALLACDKGQS
ncbi:MAG: serine hydrolase [Erythrobacter sp.]|uniref:serine hydrolase n=1 Tax=Erythrobacter sp. TaxID=1042 RepID=UPI002B487A78|nr:serine hydrolase [Erythrobacter sp.]WRH70512.1 MAG: serine hydrolase [Erythrobacter sp.]